MNFDDFSCSIAGHHPPDLLSLQLTALWYDAKNNWKKAHDLINDMDDVDSAWVHAYLHRKEGDNGNAAYWYRRAGKEICKLSLEKEWENIVQHFLS